MFGSGRKPQISYSVLSVFVQMVRILGRAADSGLHKRRDPS